MLWRNSCPLSLFLPLVLFLSFCFGLLFPEGQFHPQILQLQSNWGSLCPNTIYRTFSKKSFTKIFSSTELNSGHVFGIL